jgi:hypothetical protein
MSVCALPAPTRTASLAACGRGAEVILRLFVPSHAAKPSSAARAFRRRYVPKEKPRHPGREWTGAASLRALVGAQGQGLLRGALAAAETEAGEGDCKQR